MLVANFIESSQLIQDMAKLEHPLPVFAHWGLTGGKFWSANRKALQRGVSAPLDRLIERYRAYYGLAPNQPIPSPAGTLHAYELVGLLAAAVRQAGSSDRMAIRDALESIPAYDGLIRRYQPPFSAEQHDIIGNLPLVMARFDDAGHIVAAD